MSYIVGGILLYLLYRFITGFIWPVYKATSQVKKQFDNMRQQMQPEDNTQQDISGKKGTLDEKPKFDLGGEYIPFVEIKDK